MTKMVVATRTKAVIIFAALLRLSSKQSQCISLSPNFFSESSFSISGFKIFRKSLIRCPGLGKSYVSTGFAGIDWIIDILELELLDSRRALDIDVNPRYQTN